MSVAMTAFHMCVRAKHASRSDRVPAYERAFARTILGRDVPVLAFPRGRVALWAILRALGVDSRSEVVLPAYTCETVPMAVKFAGARCVYVDVESGGYNASLQSVREALTPQSRAVICQHTYGIPLPVGEWTALAAAHGALLVEDRCQLVKNDPQGGRTAALGSVAYFSTHFSKPFSTAQGGLAAFSDLQLHRDVEQVYAGFSDEGRRSRSRFLALQSLLYSLVVRPRNRALVGNLFRRAQRAGLIRGTVAADEYGGVMPAGYLSRATNVHAALGMEQLRLWQENLRHRRRLTRFYLDRLAPLGVDVNALADDSGDPALLMVPLLVENKDEVLRRAAIGGLPIGTWFDRCPAHVQEETAHRYDYQPGQCPRSERLIAREIHLLTAPWVTERRAAKAIAFLEKHARFDSMSCDASEVPGRGCAALGVVR